MQKAHLFFSKGNIVDIVDTFLSHSSLVNDQYLSPNQHTGFQQFTGKLLYFRSKKLNKYK